jgi:WD40 repeat protein
VISKDGGLLITGGWDGASGYAGGLKVWDARTGALVAEYGKPGEIFHAADLTPDGRYAVVGIMSEAESQRRTQVIDLLSGAVVATFNPPATSPSTDSNTDAVRTRQPMRIVVHPDGRRVVSTYPYGDAFVWDIATGKILWGTNLQFAAKEPDQQVSAAAAVSPDGRLFAFADKKTGIRLVNADTYADVRRWEAHAEHLWSLSFAPNGKWLLSTSNDDTVGVWDVATGELIARLVGHGADVLCVAMSPDGTRIAYMDAVGRPEPQIWTSNIDGSDAEILVDVDGERLVRTRVPLDGRLAVGLAAGVQSKNICFKFLGAGPSVNQRSRNEEKNR